MNIKRICKICFSPTGTTERVVSALASALSAKYPAAGVFTYDFTLPSARGSFPQLTSEALVVFGMPTYAGRLPNLMVPYLKESAQGNGALAVPVVTFGNRNFDNSLIELRDILEDHGFHTIAAAACSCEHSFSTKLGAGRPDDADLSEIQEFAGRIVSKLVEIANQHTASPDSSIIPSSPVQVPGIPADQNHGGYYQPRDRHGVFIDIRKVKPLTDMDKCTQCGLCLEVCPMGAIDPADVSKVPGICIKCGACEKKCPVHAKYYEDAGYLYHKTELEEMYARRADNAFFFNQAENPL